MGEEGTKNSAFSTWLTEESSVKRDDERSEAERARNISLRARD